MQRDHRVLKADTLSREGVRMRSHRGAVTLLMGLTALLSACGQTGQPNKAAASSPALSAQALTGLELGPNVKIFDPSMPLADIQKAVDDVFAQQVGNQFGTQRYSLLFKPGTYGSADKPLIVQVGYYTEVAGLGFSPNDVVINGHVDVYNQCDASGCIALDNFWRSLSNMNINVMGSSGCHASANFWAVSQAAPMRRVKVSGGNLSLMDYCSNPAYASGGFIADSKADFIINGSQQQFLTRNSSIGGWSNGVWNQVFAGVQGAPAQSFPNPPYTTLPTTPVSREKPYLYLDAHGRAQVFVPSARSNSLGVTWDAGQPAGRSLPLSDFYVARPSDSVKTLNNQLARGNNLLLTPGVYNVDQTIQIKRANTVVLGLGVATLTAQGGAVAMTVADVAGVDIAGVMFDAGPVNSPVLLQVGTQHPNNRKGKGHINAGGEPTALQDVFFRIGGPHLGKASLSLEVNSDNTLLDDIWAWRADHGAGVGWTLNTADTGVVVNGDNVTATGLFVEHYQKYNTIWNGENGKTIFYQNELPYDAPNQAAWKHGDVLGYAAYKVADSVKVHEAWGLGSYIFTNADPSLHASNAFEVPNTPGVKMHDLVTISLNKAGTIDHVINGVGTPVTPTFQGPSNVVSYP